LNWNFRFKIYLPRLRAAASSQLERISQAQLAGRQEHILVVEDEPALRTLLAKMLAVLNYQTTLAADGEEALRLIAGDHLRPDLVITDAVMPKMGGKELLRQLKKFKPDLKVLFMSGYTDSAIKHQGEIDVDAPFLQKPFSLSALGLKIKEVLSGKG
ncbi:MAG: response regulator, partial [Deltaproteobacteria bacterium]|nr:response regulator [Deltaproteobacteria bacterium]